MKPTFQFSSLDQKTYLDKLEQAISKLDGKYDKSKVI